MMLEQKLLWDDKRQEFNPYWLWEDFLAGMYKPTPKESLDQMVQVALEVLSCPDRCLDAMRKCIEDWPIAAAENLRDSTKNRRPWMGRACCCVTVGAREDAVRVAWWQLSENHREAANDIADRVIAEWEMFDA
jgi:hypothetical protein